MQQEAFDSRKALEQQESTKEQLCGQQEERCLASSGQAMAGDGVCSHRQHYSLANRQERRLQVISPLATNYVVVMETHRHCCHCLIDEDSTSSGAGRRRVCVCKRVSAGTNSENKGETKSKELWEKHDVILKNGSIITKENDT